MLIPFIEPTAPRYIHINQQTNRVHLMVPVVGGQEISTDNTCEATKTLREFFDGGALGELSRYKNALEFDIALLEAGNPQREAKEARLAQIEAYIGAISAMSQSYGGAMTAFLGRASNLYSIQLRPHAQDRESRVINPSFNINRGNDSHGMPLSALYNAMYSTFPGVAIAVRDPRTTLTAAVLSALPASAGFEDIQRVLGEQCSRLFGLAVDFTQRTDGTLATKEIIDALMGFGEDATRDDYIDALLGACALDVWETLPTPPFYGIPAATPADKRTERLSILTQFFLANLNVYCKAHGISGRNFGMVLDASPDLSNELVSHVSTALTSGEDVERAVCNFCNVNADTFDLSRAINADDLTAIRQTFERTYRTVTTGENPHMDDFMLLDKDATGETAKVVTHQGSICVDFAEIVDSFIPNQEYFSSIRQDFATHSAEIPHRNESIAGEVEVAIETLLAMNEEQFEKLPAAAKEACRAHPTFAVRQFLNDIAKGRQDKAEALLTVPATPVHKQILLRTPGVFTDYSGRTFNCTAYEYAYWAKDMHMCRMLESHMDNKTKAELLARINVIEGIDTAPGQPVGLVYSQRGTEHSSAHFDLKPLVDALQRYVDGYDNWRFTENWDAMRAACMKIGILQRDMPVHVVNEYCRPDRSFDPRPEFNERALPRSLRVEERSLFPLVIADSSGLGINFALMRGYNSPHSAYLGRYPVVAHIRIDLAAISHLDEIRTVDLTRLRESLLPTDREPSHSMRV